MIRQSQKLKPWGKKDYRRTILLFALHTLVIVAMYAAMLVINAHLGAVDSIEFLKRMETIKNISYIAVVIILLGAGIYLYFYNENRDFILQSKNIHLVFFVIEISILIMYASGILLKSVYSRPFALCALLMLLLINKRSAIFINGVTCLYMFMADAFLAVSSVSASEVFSCLVVNYTTSLLAIYLVGRVSSRLKVFVTGFFIAVPVAVSCLVLDIDTFLAHPYRPFLDGLTSGLLSVVLMMAILPFCERIFNVVTDYRLAELTDHKSKLIQALQKNAPGTFNHSLIVSTLAESCATAIDEDPLLARACAYYHDIGKLKNPEFFTENQKGYNPHNELTPELSTDIIRSHAKDGYKLILKYHLPQILADVALQHHGTLPIRYFYAKAMKYTEGELDIENFSYPGPKPQTKIAAIIMIADGCEAKVRTLTDRSHEKVDAAVREIIEERMDLGQFDECDITMADLDIIRKTITNSLAGVYHDRVEYPKLRIGKK